MARPSRVKSAVSTMASSPSSRASRPCRAYTVAGLLARAHHRGGPGVPPRLGAARRRWRRATPPGRRSGRRRRASRLRRRGRRSPPCRSATRSPPCRGAARSSPASPARRAVPAARAAAPRPAPRGVRVRAVSGSTRRGPAGSVPAISPLTRTSTQRGAATVSKRSASGPTLTPRSRVYAIRSLSGVPGTRLVALTRAVPSAVPTSSPPAPTASANRGFERSPTAWNSLRPSSSATTNRPVSSAESQLNQCWR